MDLRPNIVLGRGAGADGSCWSSALGAEPRPGLVGGGRAARRPPPSVPGTAIDRREHKASGYFADSAVAVAVRHRGG